MNLYFLKYYYDTIRFKSVSRAAKENHVTKSAISQGITQLEKSLKVSLITHQRTKIKATPQGEILYESCREIFQNIDNLTSRLKSSQAEYSGRLQIACSHSIGLNILPVILPKLKKAAPNVQVEVLFGHTGLVMEWLQLNKVELGLVLDNDDLSQFTLEPIYKGKFAIFESQARNPNELITSCLFPPARSEVFTIKQAFQKQFGYELKADMELCSWEVITSLVAQNHNVGVLPDYILLNPEKARILKKSKVDIAVPYTLYVASLEPLSKNAKLFSSLLQEHLAQPFLKSGKAKAKNSSKSE